MIRRDVEPQRRSTAEILSAKTDPRCAGAAARDYARVLAGPNARSQRATARRYRSRHAVVAVAVVVVSSSVTAVSWQLRTASPQAAAVGVLLCAAVAISGGRRVLAGSRRVIEARRTASSLAVVAASSFSYLDDASSRELVAAHTNLRDVGYADSLSYAGYPIGGPGVEQLMACELRAASTLARAVGLPLSAVMAIAVVDGADLPDVWGARTEIERLRHTGSLIALTYRVSRQLPAALLIACHLEPDIAALAARQLAAAIVTAEDVIHRPAAARTIALSYRRRCGLCGPEVRHG